MRLNSVPRGVYRRWSQISSRSPLLEENKGLPESDTWFSGWEGALQSDQHTISLPEQAQTSHELSVMCMQTNIASGQADATNEHAMVSRLPEPQVQHIGLPVQGLTMRSGRVVIMYYLLSSHLAALTISQKIRSINSRTTSIAAFL